MLDLCRGTQYDTNSKCEKWLAGVRASAPLDTISSDLPEETETKKEPKGIFFRSLQSSRVDLGTPLEKSDILKGDSKKQSDIDTQTMDQMDIMKQLEKTLDERLKLVQTEKKTPKRVVPSRRLPRKPLCRNMFTDQQVT